MSSILDQSFRGSVYSPELSGEGPFFQRLLKHEFKEEKFVVVKSPNPRHVYAAVRGPRGVGAVAMVASFDRGFDTVDYWMMPEGRGANELKACPREVLDALDPVEQLYDGDDAVYAARWRSQNEKELAARESRPKISRGDVVIFDKPIRFRDGEQRTSFAYTSHNRFEAGRFIYRIPRWWTYAHRVIKPTSDEHRGNLVLGVDAEAIPVDETLGRVLGLNK